MSEVEPDPENVSPLGLGTISQVGEAYAKAEFKVNLTRPITPRTGEVVCEGKVVHKGPHPDGFGSGAEGRQRQAAGFRHRNMLDLSGQSGGTLNGPAVWPPHLNVTEH
ncbi:hypothetical protein NKH45_12290 [Mesorhizobium sp. M1156]|uniref:hypothetical protein n=1 Tax=Mesorhizobium sp. M1156 TaxID=2957064 RepID=UPI0033383E7C